MNRCALMAMVLITAVAACLSAAAAAGPKIVSEEEMLGRVRVICNVSGATVSLAGFSFQTKAGKAVVVGDVPTGGQEIVARQKGYEEWRGRIAVEAGKTTTVRIEMVEARAAKPGLGRVRVTSNVEGAVFSLAGSEFRTKAAKALVIGEVPTGSYAVEARLEGYEPWKGSLEVAVDKTASLDIQMTKLSRPAPPKLWTNSIGMKFVLCPAGSFVMGSPPTEGFADERPAPSPSPFTSAFMRSPNWSTSASWAKTRASTGSRPRTSRPCS